MTKHVHAHSCVHTHTHRHTGILFSHEKGGYPAIWISLGHISLSKINQKEKGKYYMISLICGI